MKLKLYSINLIFLKNKIIKIMEYTIFIFFLWSISFIIARYIYSSVASYGSFQIFEWDMRNLYPYVENQHVNTNMLTIICAIPAISSVLSLFVFYSMINQPYDYKVKNFLRVTSINFKTILFIYMNLIITIFFTEVIKTEVAMPRPNFFNMCNYQQIRTNYTFYLENTKPYEIANIDNCYANINIIQDAISSFPSAHTSYTFSIAMSAFLLVKLFNLPFTTFTKILPFILSTYVGISRIHDYYHNVWDVLAGALLGCLISLSSFYVFYEQLVEHSNNVNKFINEIVESHFNEPNVVHKLSSLPHSLSWVSSNSDNVQNSINDNEDFSKTKHGELH